MRSLAIHAVLIVATLSSVQLPLNADRTSKQYNIRVMEALEDACGRPFLTCSRMKPIHFDIPLPENANGDILSQGGSFGLGVGATLRTIPGVNRIYKNCAFKSFVGNFLCESHNLVDPSEIVEVFVKVPDKLKLAREFKHDANLRQYEMDPFKVEVRRAVHFAVKGFGPDIYVISAENSSTPHDLHEAIYIMRRFQGQSFYRTATSFRRDLAKLVQIPIGGKGITDQVIRKESTIRVRLLLRMIEAVSTLAVMLGQSNLVHCDSHGNNIFFASAEILNNHQSISERTASIPSLENIVMSPTKVSTPIMLTGEQQSYFFPIGNAIVQNLDPENMYYIDNTFSVNVGGLLATHEDVVLPCSTYSSCRKEDPIETFRFLNSPWINRAMELKLKSLGRLDLAVEIYKPLIDVRAKVLSLPEMVNLTRIYEEFNAELQKQGSSAKKRLCPIWHIGREDQFNWHSQASLFEQVRQLASKALQETENYAGVTWPAVQPFNLKRRQKNLSE